MEETYRIKAIILNRRAFRESDLSVMVYSAEAGKQALVARGAKKFRSKSAAHLEPLCLSEIMVVRGKQFDYIGSAISTECFVHLKSDLDRLVAVGQGLKIFNQLIKEAEADQRLFALLFQFITTLNGANLKLTAPLALGFFQLKLLDNLGFRPELYHCVVCKNFIKPGGNKFDLDRSGLVCPHCLGTKSILTISDNCVKVLRLAIEIDFKQLNNIRINTKLETEIIQITNGFLNRNL